MTDETPTLHKNIWADAVDELWCHRWEVTILVQRLLGGCPGDSEAIEGWLANAARGKDAQAKKIFIESLAMEVKQEMAETLSLLSEQEADKRVLHEAAKKTSGQVFKRDEARNGELYEEARKVASMLRETACIQWPNKDSGRPAFMGKHPSSWWPEHVKVIGAGPNADIMDDRLYLGRKEPDEYEVRLVHVKDMRGNPLSGFSMHERVNDALISFTLVSDRDIPVKFWRTLFARAMPLGFGATRSQGYGRFEVVAFEKVGG